MPIEHEAVLGDHMVFNYDPDGEWFGVLVITPSEDSKIGPPLINKSMLVTVEDTGEQLWVHPRSLTPLYKD